ncbi:uncharacterized protein METZ01_LOCUS333954, partial [marine metagenome]
VYSAFIHLLEICWNLGNFLGHPEDFLLETLNRKSSVGETILDGFFARDGVTCQHHLHSF